MADAAYVGVWVLAPELCLYETGAPPRSGRYEIALDGDRVLIAIAWVGADGAAHEIAFGGPVDGGLSPSDAPGASHVSCTHIDTQTLDSAVFAGDVRIAYARRRVSDAGDLLAAVQEAALPGAATTRNFQVYRRAS